MQAFAVDLVGPACIVAQGFNAAIQVDEERLQEGLPSVQSLQSLEVSKEDHHQFIKYWKRKSAMFRSQEKKRFGRST